VRAASPQAPPVFYQDREECSNYWLCAGGCASNSECDEDYLFDTVNGYCNHPEEVECGDRPCENEEHCSSTTMTPTTHTTHTTPTTTTPDCITDFPGGHCPTSATRNFPDKSDCSKFWHCEKGCGNNQQCDLNFLFDLRTRECAAAADTDCLSRPCTDPQHCPCVNYDAHEDYFCREEDVLEFFPDTNDCARYLDCTAGCFTSVLCEDDYLFNTEYKWCTFPNEVTCGERPCPHPDRCGTQPDPTTTTAPPPTASPTSPTPSTSTTEATTTEDCGHTDFCQDHLSMGLYADPYNCRKYWICTNNGVGGEHITCESDKLFDLKYMGCNYDYLVDCQDRPICDDCDQNCRNQITTPATEYCQVHQCKQDGFFCETKCSNNYCQCFGGTGFLKHCPEGQLWDCDENACNYPCLVDEGACC